MPDPDEAYAVVLIHNPKDGTTLQHPFYADDHENPVLAAWRYISEHEHTGEFPGHLWTVASNQSANILQIASRLSFPDAC